MEIAKESLHWSKSVVVRHAHSVLVLINFFTYILFKTVTKNMAIWPSGLRRQNQAPASSGPKGRGFESLCCHAIIGVSFFLKTPVPV